MACSNMHPMHAHTCASGGPLRRWNAQAVDPNRSFSPEGEVVAGRSFNPEASTEESAAVIAFLGSNMHPMHVYTCASG